MIVYKIKDGKIVSVSRKDANYVLKVNEYGSDVWYQKPLFTGTEVVESITQEEIDAQNTEQIKRDNIATQRLLNTVVWEGETISGNYYIVSILDDGKLESTLIP